MFLLSPRILAEGFYNSKDITFMSFLLLASYFLIRSWEKRDGVRFAVLAGIASGYATDIRILGLVQLPIVTLIYLLLFVQESNNLKLWLRKYIMFLGSYSLTVYVLFPYLWSNPVLNLIKVFKSMSKYNWDGHVLYAGNRILAHDLPWHYIPVWIGITTPILYLVFFVIGLFASVLSLTKGIRSRQSFVNERNNIFVLLSLFIPLIAIIGLHSTLYDGWRHMYFIYPYILLLATEGYIWLERFLKNKKNILEIGSWALIGVVLIWVLTNNPRQNLYFNAFAGNNIPDNWEMDYWGLSNESALRYILENDHRSKITVQEVSFTPLEVSSKMLNEQEQSRLIFQRNNDLSADYIVNNFRSGSAEPIPATFVGYKSMKKFKADGFTYLEILKRVS
jgi:4-amino-4-deoxy-L-arabinose transferase-like glycosyltransferase